MALKLLPYLLNSFASDALENSMLQVGQLFILRQVSCAWSVERLAWILFTVVDLLTAWKQEAVTSDAGEFCYSWVQGRLPEIQKDPLEKERQTLQHTKFFPNFWRSSLGLFPFPLLTDPKQQQTGGGEGREFFSFFLPLISMVHCKQHSTKSVGLTWNPEGFPSLSHSLLSQ